MFEVDGLEGGHGQVFWVFTSPVTPDDKVGAAFLVGLTVGWKRKESERDC